MNEKKYTTPRLEEAKKKNTPYRVVLATLEPTNLNEEGGFSEDWEIHFVTNCGGCGKAILDPVGAFLVVHIAPQGTPTLPLGQVKGVYFYDLVSHLEIVHESCAVGPGIRLPALYYFCPTVKLNFKPQFEGKKPLN
jgi:hypothetical protein